MSTNVYRSEQVIHYALGPKTYWGWWISWVDESDSAYPFSEQARLEDWVKLVREARPDWDEYEVELAAAAFAIYHWGPQSGTDGIRYAIEDRYDDDASEKLDDLATRFDPSGHPGTPLAPEPSEGER